MMAAKRSKMLGKQSNKPDKRLRISKNYIEAHSNVAIANDTGSALPAFLSAIPFRDIKEEILGKDYDLNLIFTTAAKIKKLNTIYRNKEEATDILSFPLSENEGEIYICPSEARKEAKKFGRTYENFIAFLFIHGCAHLKGYNHGSIMEDIEAKTRKKFRI